MLVFAILGAEKPSNDDQLAAIRSAHAKQFEEAKRKKAELENQDIQAILDVLDSEELAERLQKEEEDALLNQEVASTELATQLQIEESAKEAQALGVTIDELEQLKMQFTFQELLERLINGENIRALLPAPTTEEQPLDGAREPMRFSETPERLISSPAQSSSAMRALDEILARQLQEEAYQ